MKHIIISLFAAIVLFVPAVKAQRLESNNTDTVPEAATPIGAWNINYTLGPTTAVRQVRFVAYSDKTGRFILGNTSPTTNAGFRAVWDGPHPLFNFSGEVRIPLGNVGVETGTLVFKSIAGNASLLNCHVVYVQNILTIASTVPYTIKTGTCVATPVSPTP